MDAAIIEQMKGVVHSLNNGKVRTLVSYGITGKEKMYCYFPRKLWPESNPPEPFQSVILKWKTDSENPIIVVDNKSQESANLEVMKVYTKEAKELLGISEKDRVLILIGPTPICSTQQNTEWNYWQILAEWGETIASPRLSLLLTSLGVCPTNIETIISDARINNFNPLNYTDHHIFFLGSTVSNTILSQYYWNHDSSEWKTLRERYLFSKENISLKIIEQQNPNGKIYNTTNPQRNSITDYFLLAKVRNPYSEKANRFCFLSSGIGTVGTGYGAIMLTCRDSVNRILENSNGDNFDLVGEVSMNGFPMPEMDSIRMLHYNGNPKESVLLNNAITSPKVWDSPDTISERDIELMHQMQEYL